MQSARESVGSFEAHLVSRTASDERGRSSQSFKIILNLDWTILDNYPYNLS